MFKREVDTNRQLYDGLLQRFKEIGVAGNVGANNISVVDPADAPGREHSPRMAFNLALALMFGLFAGVIVAAVAARLARSRTVTARIGTCMPSCANRCCAGNHLAWDRVAIATLQWMSVSAVLRSCDFAHRKLASQVIREI